MFEAPMASSLRPATKPPTNEELLAAMKMGPPAK
jgi:hypothetical protein